MLTGIGGKRPAAQDAVDLLLECHERIRAFLALSEAVAAAAAAGERDPSVVEAASRVRRYFVEALPLHARDEEDSVLPRLRGRDAALDAALEAMARQHREHERPLGALVGGCAELARDPGLGPALAPALRGAAAELRAHFALHLAGEEAIVFPALRKLLDPGEDAALVREIRARRSPG